MMLVLLGMITVLNYVFVAVVVAIVVGVVMKTPIL